MLSAGSVLSSRCGLLARPGVGHLESMCAVFTGIYIAVSIAGRLRAWTSQRARQRRINKRFPSLMVPARDIGKPCEDVCAICLDPKANGQLLKKMACEHDFHVQCFDTFIHHNLMSEKVRCPMCRALELL
mmetsp:Transcript_67907/g.221066  ORF Transcript_67907/g.221066 Transcript_67907/m.221066 type:complete len:130 (-) Transcript_67907:334-723(-)